MKSNHDIDKLFSQKLDSLESAPSMDAWLKLEKNLQEKRKKRVIWLPYAAAAAVTLLIVSVWLVNGWEKRNNNTIANTSGQTPKTQQAHQPEIAINEQAATKNSPTSTPPVKEEPLVAIEQENNKNAVKEKQTTISEVQKEIPVAQVKHSRDTEPAIQVIEVEEKLALQTPAVIDNKIPQQPSVVVVVQVEASESPVSTAETEQEAFDKPNKQTRAGKLLTKLKKIKKAEFEELGIRPESIVAFVKDKTGKH